MMMMLCINITRGLGGAHGGVEGGAENAIS